MAIRRKQDFTFSQVPQATIPRSVFNRDHMHKTTFNEGYLIPLYVDEALPGDTFTLKLTMLARLGTPIVPIMDNLYLDVFFFFVPNRLLWTNWQKFCGEQTNPGDSTSFTVPQVNYTSATGNLFDYFGLPLGADGAGGHSFNICAFFSRAYNLIWNQWFRDQNMQNSVVVDTGDGPDNRANYVLLKRGKRHDYFTSALPFPQKGTAVAIPLGTTAPVSGTIGTSGTAFTWQDTAGAEQRHLQGALGNTVGTGQVYHSDTGTGALQNAVWGNQTGLALTGAFADLTNATAATINSLRQAFQIQKLLERDARGGTRYAEILKAHFGVTSPDARLQRPEYLGGGSAPIIITPVAQTAPTVAGQTPQGNLAAFATVGAHNIGFTKSFTEHGVILGLVATRADLSYWQGINRMWLRQTRYDFYWPAFAHLGEQAITNIEIYADQFGNNSTVFGYQERWAEYRYKPSILSGLHRPKATGSIGFWNLAQDFSAAPVLGNTFIVEDAPMTRVLAVAGAPHFILDSYFQVRCARPMPVYSVPGLIDHF